MHDRNMHVENKNFRTTHTLHVLPNLYTGKGERSLLRLLYYAVVRVMNSIGLVTMDIVSLMRNKWPSDSLTV